MPIEIPRIEVPKLDLPTPKLPEQDPSLSRYVFSKVESSFKPGGFVAKQLDTLSKKGLLPGGVNHPMMQDGMGLVSAVAHNLGRFDTIATGTSGKFGRDLWRDTWMEAKNKAAEINNANRAAGISMPDHIVNYKALRSAIKEVGGDNYEHYITFLKAAEQEHGPAKAAFLANSLQLMMGDKPYHPLRFSYDGEGNIKFEKIYESQTSDLFRHVMKDPELGPKLSGRWSEAKKPGAITSAAQMFTGYSHMALAPGAVLKHIPQVPGLMSNLTSFENGYVTLGALFGKGFADGQALLKFNDAAADMHTDMAADVWRYKNGWYSKAKWLNPKIGMWLARQGATPFLRGLRYRLSTAAGVQGHFVLHEAAHILERDPHNRAAQVNLGYLGLRHEDVMHEWYALNRQLSMETKRTAINTNIEKRAFSYNPAYRSAMALSPVGRAATVYEWMTQNEKSWFQRELVRALHSRSPMQLGSFAATMGLLYPGVHWAMSKVNEVYQGKKDPMEAGKEVIDPAEDAQMQAHMIQVYVDMMGIGTEWSKVNAASHGRLLEEGIGGRMRAAYNLIQDSAHAVTGKGHRAAYPLWRDILEDLPWHVGSWAAHKYFPTRAEIAARKPMTAARRAAQRAAEKRQYLDQ